MLDWLPHTLSLLFDTISDMTVSYAGNSTSILVLFVALSILLVILRLFLPRG